MNHKRSPGWLAQTLRAKLFLSNVMRWIPTSESAVMKLHKNKKMWQLINSVADGLFCRIYLAGVGSSNTRTGKAVCLVKGVWNRCKQIPMRVLTTQKPTTPDCSPVSSRTRWDPPLPHQPLHSLRLCRITSESCPCPFWLLQIFTMSWPGPEHSCTTYSWARTVQLISQSLSLAVTR